MTSKHICTCARPFTSSSGLRNHMRVCPVEQARSAAVVAAYEAGRHSTAMAEGAIAARAAVRELSA